MTKKEVHYNIIDLLNKKTFYGCAGVKIGDCLYHRLKTDQEIGASISFFSAFKHLLKTLLFRCNKYDTEGDKSTLFLLTQSYICREEMREAFSRVVRLSSNRVVLYPGKKHFTLARFKYTAFFFTWFNQLRVIESVPLRLDCLSRIMDAFILYMESESYFARHKINIEYLLVLNDTQCTDSFFVQKYNYNKKCTISLQHGVFCSTYLSWAFTGSHSKYLLANSQYTVDEGKKAGYKNRMIITGPFSYVGMDIKRKLPIKAVKKIGLFLDSVYDDDNVRAIKMISSCCKTSEKQLIIKLHPLNDCKLYEEICEEGPITIVGTEKTVFDVFDMIDLAVVRYSTVLIEALQYGIPSYIISDPEQRLDVYNNAEFLKFSSVDEFTSLINKRVEDIMRDCEEGRLYFCGAEDITRRYEEAFQLIGIN